MGVRNQRQIQTLRRRASTAAFFRQIRLGRVFAVRWGFSHRASVLMRLVRTIRNARRHALSASEEPRSNHGHVFFGVDQRVLCDRCITNV